MARGPLSSSFGIFLSFGLLFCLSLHFWSARIILKENVSFLESLAAHQESHQIPLSRREQSVLHNDTKRVQLAKGKLSCHKWGGPVDALEMVYWRDQDSQSNFSLVASSSQEKFLLFDADCAGWNNKRISFEIFCLLARLMGRTLVLPPKGEWFGLFFKPNISVLGFDDVYDLNLLQTGISVISTQEFLDRQVLTYHNNTVATPPKNRTDWDGSLLLDLRTWLRQVTHPLTWRHEDCILGIPSNPNDVSHLVQAYQNIQHQQHSGGYVPVNASIEDRMREILLGRRLCFDNETIQHSKYLYYQITQQEPFSMQFNQRLLVWFYQFLFFEDYTMELSAKRFVRDTLRYKDELQCAAARIVQKLRVASKNGGIFYTFHCRRSEQFSHQFGHQPTAIEIVDISLVDIPAGSTVYIATDEFNRTWFQPFLKTWNVYFLKDFEKEIQGIASDYYGMIDQLVASRGTKFFGSWSSTFTGYISRLQGYHTQLEHLDGWKDGLIDTYFYQTERRYAMRKYESPKKYWFAREFPLAWRDIDHDG